MTRPDARITVGLLFRGQMRRFLTEAKFLNEVEDWTEVKGFLDSRFLIRGASSLVISKITSWANDLNTPVVHDPS